jgi:hypothetical protein
MLRDVRKLPRPSARTLSLVALVVALGAVGAVLLARSRHPTPAGALAAVPRDAWLVAVVDVASLRASPIAKAAFGTGSSTLVPGVGPMAELCGFDPVARLREVVVASPEGGERGDFGVAFTGEFSKDELAACAEKVIRSRLGQPSTTTRGSFTLIEGTAESAASGGAQLARVAYREGGPFLVGRGAWLDAMIDATDGKIERERSEHAALREALSKAGPSPRTVLVTAVLPKGLRERLKSEFAGEVVSAGPAAKKAYAGVLAVEEAGLSMGTGGPASSTDIAAELRCESQSDCEALRDFLQEKRSALSRDLGVRLIGLGPLIDSFTVDVRGPSLSAAAHASTGDLAHAVERAMGLLSARHAPPAKGPSSAPPEASAPPPRN